ncbi:RNA polymerase sigma factor [Paenibacillus thermotolerans]|uniref:RNA polymerase sigma factor n=1 Tax=Paenibacillus thermotolerans TaxID=3027807 RepID=UPI00236814DF|nr:MULTISPECIES: sigma-70 family RNA polymerase sigma factor [unclassified Paenibacillus]
MQPKSDAELVALICNKSKPALEELYDRYVRLVYSYAYKATNSEQASKDIVQQVFERLWTSAARYDADKGQFVNWLITLTRRIAIDMLRKPERREVPTPLSEEHLPDDEGFDELLANREAVREAFARLSEKQRLLLEQMYWKGRTLKEIADDFGEPIGTLKSRLHEALKSMRAFLDDREGGGRHAATPASGL